MTKRTSEELNLLLDWNPDRSARRWLRDGIGSLLVHVVIVGFVLEKFVRGLFGTPVIAAIFLVVNGLLLLFGEQLRNRGHRELSTLTMMDALYIGLWQCTALIPGISRSGATIVGGVLRGITHEGAAHFSFLIATPIILGATVLEVP